MSRPVDHTLVCPFLDDSPAYALGVEFGLLYARMRSGEADVIHDIVTRANQDQITLAAGRLGWEVLEMRPRDRDWMWLCLRRREARP